MYAVCPAPSQCSQPACVLFEAHSMSIQLHNRKQGIVLHDAPHRVESCAYMLKVYVTNRLLVLLNVCEVLDCVTSATSAEVWSHFRYHDPSSIPFLDSSPVSSLHLRRYCLHRPHHPVSYSMVLYLMRAHGMECVTAIPLSRKCPLPAEYRASPTALRELLIPTSQEIIPIVRNRIP